LALRGSTRFRVDPEGSSPANAGLSRRNLVFGGSQWTQTMMQLCASAAKLRGGGPILIFGVKAMGMYRVTATSNRHRQFVASEADERRNFLSLLNRYRSTESCRRAQRNALQDVAGRDKPPKRDEQLSCASCRQRRTPDTIVSGCCSFDGSESAKPTGPRRDVLARCPLWRDPFPVDPLSSGEPVSPA